MTDLLSRVNDPQLTPFQRLTLIMEILRSPDGCAWDRKQTHQSLVPYLIEEAYEVIEAVESGDPQQLKEELGDLLCQVVFHGQLAREAGTFTTDDAVESITTKLISRHPHVFGEQAALNPDQVRDQWEQIKVESGEKKSVLGGLPSSMPALMMAFRVGEKAGGVGFDWGQASDVIDKLDEELAEIKEAVASGDKDRIADEIGDMLFATASLARKLEIDPESTLKASLKKFRERFSRLESEVNGSGKRFKEYTLDELEAIWQRVK